MGILFLVLVYFYKAHKIYIAFSFTFGFITGKKIYSLLHLFLKEGNDMWQYT